MDESKLSPKEQVEYMLQRAKILEEQKQQKQKEEKEKKDCLHLRRGNE